MPSTKHEDVEPIENAVVYLTANMGVGQRLTMESIDRRLERLPTRRTLVMLSEMAFKAEKASVPPLNVEAQVEFARRIFPARAVPRIEARLRTPYPPAVALSPQIAVLLGIRLLTFASDSRPDVDTELDNDGLARELGALCLALGDHCDQGILSAETTILEVLRLGLFFSQSSHSAWMAIAARLFFDVLPRLEDHPDWMDPLTTFETAAGISLRRFWAITSVQGTAASHSEEHFLFPLNIEETPIPEAELNAWASLLMTSLDDAAASARIDIRSPIGWSMSSVWSRPVINLGQGRGPVLRGQLLDLQAEPARVFWHIRHALVSQGVSHQSWSNLYGAAVEQLGLDLLEEHIPEAELMNEAAFVKAWAIPDGSKRADAAISTATGDLVVIDFVSRQFSRDTATTGDFSALERDLRMGVVEKLVQVDTTLGHAVSAGAGHARIFPIVVLGGPFPAIPAIDVAIDLELASAGVRVIGSHHACRKWAALDLVSLLLLLRGSTLKGVPVADLLEQWQRSSLARNTFREWALRSGITSDLPGGGVPNDWLNLVIDIISEPLQGI